jgi:hypothetical protein
MTMVQHDNDGWCLQVPPLTQREVNLKSYGLRVLELISAKLGMPVADSDRISRALAQVIAEFPDLGLEVEDLGSMPGARTEDLRGEHNVQPTTRNQSR